MKTRFDWQADDQSALFEKGRDAEGRSAGKRPGCLVSILTVTAVVVILFAWQFIRRQSKAIASVKEDVVLAFKLQQRAAENGDGELFSSLLSSDDLAWKRDQGRLLEAGLINERAPLNLIGIPHTGTYSSIDLSPNLQQAKLIYGQEYEVSEGAANARELALLNTIFYRMEDGRWKQTAAGRSYWGPTEKREGIFTDISFPRRDAGLAQVLFTRLERHLEQICSEIGDSQNYGSSFCAGTDPLRINLSTEDNSLLKIAVTPVAATSDFDYELPAPSIIGVPQEDGDIDVYLELYERPIIQHMQRLMSSAMPYPNQDIYALCFKHPLNGRHLYRFDWQRRSWYPLLSTHTFKHLSTLPDHSAIMLAGDGIVTVIDISRNLPNAEPVEIRQWNLPEVSSQSLAGWIRSKKTPFHLVQHAAVGGEPPAYSALDLRECDASGCLLEALPGFPIPAAMGDASLYQIGSEIVLESDALDHRINFGAGFTPFWLDDEVFGFVRFAGDRDTGINTEVVLGRIDGDGLKRLFDGSDLAREAGIQFGSVLFVNEVAPNPADSGQLVVSSTGIRDYAGQYYLFSVKVSDPTVEPEITLEVARSGSQGGVPGLMTPTGPPLFLFSPDGRWLAITELKSGEKETWTVLAHDLETGTSSQISDSVPAMPGNYPLLDWSSDGQWLLVADRQFLHLISPARELQEIVAHDFDACSHVVWVG